MPALIPWLLALAALTQNAAPPPAELRAALEALREGAPGEPLFEAALPRLPELIRSGEAHLVAGGAYLAGKHGRGECATALLDTFGAWGGLGTPGRRSVLDALVRLDIRLEPGRLPPSRWCEDLTYVLLARDAERHRDELMSLHDACARGGPVRWACAVTLARLRDPRLAERLLSDDPWPVRVAVRDAGSHVDGGGRTRSMSVSCGRPSWPPSVQYRLQLPEAGEPLPLVVPSSRREFRTCHYSNPLTLDQQADWRRRLVGELLGVPPPALAEDLDLEWGGDEAFASVLRERLAEQRAKFGRIALELAALELLGSPGKVAALATFEIRLLDAREQPAGTLPRPELGPRVVYAD
ncbi:MAG TPA: hypothetical protein VMT18_03865 [Planctomycetota bacterium]|nr:hypothetical protein [Planctomycetota bacterium]